MDQHKVDFSILLSELHRRLSVYIAEHLTGRQGSIRLFQYLFGLKEFQSIRHLVSKAFGMVSRKDKTRGIK